MVEPDGYTAVVHALLADPAVGGGQMMGMPALKVGGKMFGGLAPPRPGGQGSHRPQLICGGDLRSRAGEQ